MSVFNDHELELLISGLPEIDVDDLRANTEYSGFTAGSPVMQWFWEVVREMDAEQLALLVQFVTGMLLCDETACCGCGAWLCVDRMQTLHHHVLLQDVLMLHMTHWLNNYIPKT